MKIRSLVLLPVILSIMSNITDAQSPAEFAESWERSRISTKLPSNARHADLKDYINTLRSKGLAVELIGYSWADREIYRVDWGKGPLKVLMWSQMHGDEPTATSALVDMFAFLSDAKADREWVRMLEESVTIRAIPMLNPDGSEVFQRYNFQGIDINRDARALRTPEGRVLKAIRDEFEPQIGFNLHNQRELTTVGSSLKQASISLLAVSGSPDPDATTRGHERNRRLCALVIKALNEFIPGHIARYDDSFNPFAFGDNISAWGSPVILVETGGLHGKDEHFLVKMNFVAYLTALQGLVDGSEKRADPGIYDSLPFNGAGRLFNVILRNATLIQRYPESKQFEADIGINRSRRREQFPPPYYIQEIGELSRAKGLDEFDVSGYFVVSRRDLRPGTLTELLFYKKDREVDWNTENLEETFPPDGIFALGEWLKPLPHKE